MKQGLIIVSLSKIKVFPHSTMLWVSPRNDGAKWQEFAPSSPTFPADSQSIRSPLSRTTTVLFGEEFRSNTDYWSTLVIFKWGKPFKISLHFLKLSQFFWGTKCFWGCDQQSEQHFQSILVELILITVKLNCFVKIESNTEVIDHRRCWERREKMRRITQSNYNHQIQILHQFCHHLSWGSKKKTWNQWW